MNYVPLFGRWATLFLVAAIAAGAAALSFGISGKLSNGLSMSPRTAHIASGNMNPWAAVDSALADLPVPDQVVVVRPDGSVIADNALAPTNVEENDGSEGGAWNEDRIRDGRTFDSSADPTRSVRRIE